MNTWAVIPVKRFDAAKSRLASCLSPGGRAELSRALFGHVARVLASTPGIDGIVVATDSPEVARVAATLGATAVRDRFPQPLSGVVDDALAELARRGVDRALVVMSDLPELSRTDVKAVLAALDESDRVVAPDTSGTHTNALALPVGRPFATRFGRADSLLRHVEDARALGLSLTQVLTPGLAFDVDTPEDHARYVGRLQRTG